jgi:hypothetical protein
MSRRKNRQKNHRITTGPQDTVSGRPNTELTAVQALAVCVSHAFPSMEMGKCLSVAENVDRNMIPLGGRILGPKDVALQDKRREKLLGIHTVLSHYETEEQRASEKGLVERCQSLLEGFHQQKIERLTERNVARAENSALRNLLEVYLVPGAEPTPVSRYRLDTCAKILLAHPSPGGINQTKSGG